MSIQSEIDRLNRNVAQSYEAVRERGGAVPEEANSDNLAAAINTIPESSGGSNIPPGGIIIWSGASDAVPEGWVLCNGSNGTPDLRGRFVLGTDSSYPVGRTGGSEEVTLTVRELPRHTHSIFSRTPGTASNSPALIRQSSNVDGSSGTDTAASSGYSGEGYPHSNMPPYYVLCYIMKL